jgi:tetratricopeptide (TPR) repeat protein
MSTFLTTNQSYRLLTLLCLLSVFSFTSCQKAKTKPKSADRDQQWLDRIVYTKMQQGASAKSIAEFEAYVKSFPRDSLAWTILGNVHCELDSYTEADKCYERALNLDPQQHQAMTGKGILYRKLGLYQKSLEAYEQAIAIEPSYAEAYSSMAIVALKLKQDQKAVEYGLRAYELDSKNPVIAANLSVAYHHVNDTPRRDKFYEIAKKLGYKNLDALQQIFAGEVSIRD